jgi:hypothetical protein
VQAFAKGRGVMIKVVVDYGDKQNLTFSCHSFALGMARFKYECAVFRLNMMMGGSPVQSVELIEEDGKAIHKVVWSPEKGDVTASLD